MITATRPDLLVLDKAKKSMCKIVDFSIPQDARVEQSQDEKFEKYQDLEREIRRIWQVKKSYPTHSACPWDHPKSLESKFGRNWSGCWD